MPSLALLIRLVASMQLVGNGHCPAPAQVEQRLQALSPPGDGTSVGSPVGSIDEIGAGKLRLRMRDAEGTLIAERSLPVGRSCAARAQASAVIFAAWQSELATASPAFPETQVVAEPAPEVAPPPHVAAEVPPPRPSPLSLEFGAGIGAGWASIQVEPGLRLEAGLLRLGGAWSAELSVTAGLPRQETFEAGGGNGGARWMRSSVALSGVHRWALPSLKLHLEAGAVLTYLTAHGVQLATPRPASAWNGGLRAGLRLLLPGRVSPWLLFDATFWPITRSLQIGVTPASVPLPNYELGLAIGGTFALPLKGSEPPAD